MLPHTPYQPPCHITWQGISIEVRYTPLWFDMPGYQIAHLEVRTISPAQHPLPFTDTGYRSLFLPAGQVETAGRPAVYVLNWLKHGADAPEWQERVNAGRQMVLF